MRRATHRISTVNQGNQRGEEARGLPPMERLHRRHAVRLLPRLRPYQRTRRRGNRFTRYRWHSAINLFAFFPFLFLQWPRLGRVAGGERSGGAPTNASG